MTVTTTLPRGIDLLPSGSFRARVQWKGAIHVDTFPSQAEAVAWRNRTKRQLSLGTHDSQQDIDVETGEELPPLFSDYSAGWIASRPLKPRTRADYKSLIDAVLVPAFGQHRVSEITPKMVKAWHSSLLPDSPTQRARAYGLLRTIMNTAYSDDIISANPCRVRGAGTAKRTGSTTLPTAVQVRELAEAMPSDKYRVMVLVSAWCGLRFGELTELRRKDLVLVKGLPVTIRVRRGVVRVGGEFIVDSPKSYAGHRDISVPPHVRQDLQDHLESLPLSPEALLFPGSRNGLHMAPSALYRVWYPARDSVGLPGLRWHDLRHFAGTSAARTGATLAEIQSRLGHSTVHAAMKYQHAASERDALMAERLSDLA